MRRSQEDYDAALTFRIGGGGVGRVGGVMLNRMGPSAILPGHSQCESQCWASSPGSEAGLVV